MESDLLNGTESISIIAFLPYESDLLKDAEIFTALESHLLHGAELFLLSELYLLKLAEISTYCHGHGGRSTYDSLRKSKYKEIVCHIHMARILLEDFLLHFCLHH